MDSYPSPTIICSEHTGKEASEFVQKFFEEPKFRPTFHSKVDGSKKIKRRVSERQKKLAPPKKRKVSERTKHIADVLEKFFGNTQNPMPDNHNNIVDVSDSGYVDSCPMKKLPISVFESHLKMLGGWKDWKYSIEMKVGMVKGKERKPANIVAEVNLLQAAVLKKDIELLVLRY